MINKSDIVACICEGNSEKYILEILLNNNVLIFNRDQILDDRILVSSYRQSKKFADQYLNMDYEDQKLVILIILDSKKINFEIDDLYIDKIRGKYLIITSPELEMLMIHSRSLYDEYYKVKSSTKPSIFLAEKLKLKTSKIKSKNYIYDHFEKFDLIDAINTHKRKSAKHNKDNHLFLADLLK